MLCERSAVYDPEELSVLGKSLIKQSRRYRKSGELPPIELRSQRSFWGVQPLVSLKTSGFDDQVPLGRFRPQPKKPSSPTMRTQSRPLQCPARAPYMPHR